jgi:predicted RecA/RadA family phage recombinase
MGRKVSDGKSVRVTVPGNTTVEQGAFVLLDGFLGLAVQKVVTGAGETKSLILNIEPGEYETSQINKTQDFAVGTKIYWDAAKKEFTETPTAVLAGVVTNGKDNDGVIWFRLAPGIINDEAAEAIGAMTTLTTTEKGSLVGAINEVNANADAAQADATAALARVAANVTCADDADADAVRTALRELLAALETAGLMLMAAAE